MNNAHATWCPVCDAGWAAPVHIMPADVHGVLCSECEAFWEQGAPCDAAHFMQLSHWLAHRRIAAASLVITRNPQVG